MGSKKYGPFLPVINTAPEREEAIKKNTLALFEVQAKKKESAVNTGYFSNFYNALDKIKEKTGEMWDDLRTVDALGKQAIAQHDKSILKYAQKYNVDPDLTRSVMYAENARGHKFGLNSVSDFVGVSSSPLPMNVQKARWSSLIGKAEEDMYDPDANIEASTVLLKRIRDRVRNPNADTIGSVWHNIGATQTDEFGEYIGAVYTEKPWKKLF